MDTFVLSITDNEVNGAWTKTRSVVDSNSKPDTAECVLEPSSAGLVHANLANYYKAYFGTDNTLVPGCSADSTTLGFGGFGYFTTLSQTAVARIQTYNGTSLLSSASNIAWNSYSLTWYNYK